MVGELEVIFALDAVAGELRVARHALVFLKQLRRVATLPVILPITSGLTPEVLASRPPTTTAPAAALTIVDQIPTSLTRSFPLRLRLAGRRIAAPGPDPLVPNCALRARYERPIASGVERVLLSFSQGSEPGPRL